MVILDDNNKYEVVVEEWKGNDGDDRKSLEEI